MYFQNDEYITNIKTSVRECLERLEFKTNQGRSFYFGSRTSVEHSERLAIADKGQVIAFAGDLSTSSLLSLQAIYIIPEAGAASPEEDGSGNENGADEEEDEEKRVVGDILIPEDWNTGEFEVNINRCSNCTAHFDYCWHSEDEYIEQFNSLGELILQMFPKALLIGNYERPLMLGDFEVYIRSIGFKENRDGLDRLMLFKKSARGRYPEGSDILDHLICLSFIYGDSKKLAIDQKLQK